MKDEKYWQLEVSPNEKQKELAFEVNSDEKQKVLAVECKPRCKNKKN